MAHILLIRHGENEFTKKGKLAGWIPGVHLNDAGRRQAAALAEHLARFPIKAIYSSPLVRTLETARPLAEAKHLQVKKCQGIGEVRYGTWQGKSLKVLRRRKLWPVLQQRPTAAQFPGGETMRAVQARAVEAVEEIAAGHRKQLVAVFSHGDVIRMILAHYLGMPLDLFQRIYIGTASISAVHVSAGTPMVTRINQAVPLPEAT
ncbi:MAG: MSMEG_4193 family putative phosphomutase [Anaerolineales bacterium]